MRLLVVEPNYSGGTETVSIQLVRQFTSMLECVVWALPPYRMRYYQDIIPSSDRLIYEPLHWGQDQNSIFYRRVDGGLRRLEGLLPVGSRRLHNVLSGLRLQLADARLRYLTKKHRLTHYFTTWIFNQPVPKVNNPVGAMVMDLNWRHFPENFPEASAAQLDRSFGQWLHKADVLFPISEFTLSEIRDAFPWFKGNVLVVPHGSRGPEVGRQMPVGETQIGGGGARPFFYYPAGVLVHKNHLLLLEAATILFQRGYDFDLLLSGAGTEHFLEEREHPNPAVERCRKFCAKNAGTISRRIKALGVLDRQEVDGLYRRCLSVVLPSRFEGFGLPLLEAIEHGTRVICTDIPPFIEQIKRFDYADMVKVCPANEVDALVAEMEHALNGRGNPELPAEVIAAKLARWTWKDVAVAYVESLQRLR
jgi:glycosyltransferase involved in cell wall biosynthesis